jgi:hypothetical protein
MADRKAGEPIKRFSSALGLGDEKPHRGRVTGLPIAEKEKRKNEEARLAAL